MSITEKLVDILLILITTLILIILALLMLFLCIITIYITNDSLVIPFLSMLSLAASSVICITILTGFTAIVKRSRIMLITNILLLIFITGLSVAVLIWATVESKENIREAFLRKIIPTMRNSYSSNPLLQLTVDKYQQTFSCCGLVELRDWKKIPPSCCVSMTTNCTVINAFEMTCLGKVGSIKTTMITLVGIISGIELTQLLAMILYMKIYL